MNYQSLGLDRTIHVTSNRWWGGPYDPRSDSLPHGTTIRGGDVPHEAANLQCNVPIGTYKDPESGEEWPMRCKRRAGHEPAKDEQVHVPVDSRIVAAPTRVARRTFFMAAGVPAGVNLSITAPHDCENHLD